MAFKTEPIEGKILNGIWHSQKEYMARREWEIHLCLLIMHMPRKHKELFTN